MVRWAILRAAVELEMDGEGGPRVEIIRPRGTEPRPNRAIILDGDDTLWVTQWLYDQAEQEMGLLVQQGGIDGVAWESEFRKRDIGNVRQFGFGSGRFATSAIAAYVDLCEQAGIKVDTKIAARMGQAAATVFRRRAPLVGGVVDTLRALRGDYQLIVVTKGDVEVQRRRVAASGLLALLDGVVIVPDKREETFRETCRAFNVDPEQSISIGNSRPSDVEPAVRIGMLGIWIDAHSWEHEKRGNSAPLPPGISRLPDFRGVLDMVRALGRQAKPPRAAGPDHADGPGLAA